MQIWIAKPRLILPQHLQRQRDHDQQEHVWRRRVFTAMGSGVSISALNAGALRLAATHHTGWAAALLALEILPVLWLVDKVSFLQTPRHSLQSETTSDLIQLP